jgi:hypothetical protein
VFEQGDAEAAEYFRRAYYLVGMLYAAGLADEAITALSEASKRGQKVEAPTAERLARVLLQNNRTRDHEVPRPHLIVM